MSARDNTPSGRRSRDKEGARPTPPDFPKADASVAKSAPAPITALMQDKTFPPPKRDAKGHFLPGQSGCPGGRFKGHRDLRETCRSLTPECLDRLMAIVRDPESRASDVFASACRIIAYAYGLPTVHVRTDDSSSGKTHEEWLDALEASEKKEIAEADQVTGCETIQ